MEGSKFASPRKISSGEIKHLKEAYLFLWDESSIQSLFRRLVGYPDFYLEILKICASVNGEKT